MSEHVWRPLPPPRRKESAPGWAVPTVALLTVAWLLATPLLAIGSLMELWTFLGEQPTAADHDRAQRQALLATLMAAGCPAVALVVGARWQRGAVQALFGVGAVFGLVGGLLLYGLVSPDSPPTPLRDDGPRYCQEHSGGDATCPGG
ncbi:hypothetical protein [uncultured Modestobacter sp.]|uniref:hypothetical protein n=1 Tax=uncultured Modestobacter sp. TaxID=380048 RepID=UPI002631A04F|nr:hypothetical protein [uncultured Modestobacter sp.]